MNKREEILDKIQTSLNKADIFYDCFAVDPNRQKLIFPGTGLEVILRFENNFFYVRPIAEYGDETKYPRQDAITKLLLYSLQENYEEDHTHMTNALVRDKEKSRDGYVVFKPGPVKIREVEDLPSGSYLEIFREIALLVDGAFLDGMPMPLGYSSPEVIDEALHIFKVN